MIFNKFKISAAPFITDAYCKCGNGLKQVTNGLMSVAMYCPKCENVYTLKLIKAPAKDVTEKFLKQCREETKEHKS